MGSSGLNELIVAIGRSHDPNEKLIPHLETLLQIPLPSEKTLGNHRLGYQCINFHF